MQGLMYIFLLSRDGQQTIPARNMQEETSLRYLTDFQSRMVIYTGILHIIHIPSQSQIIMSLQTIGLQLTRTELRMMVVRLQMISRRSLSV